MWSGKRLAASIRSGVPVAIREVILPITGAAIVLKQGFSGHPNPAVMLVGAGLASPAAYAHLKALLGGDGEPPALPPSPPSGPSPLSSSSSEVPARE